MEAGEEAARWKQSPILSSHFQATMHHHGDDTIAASLRVSPKGTPVGCCRRAASEPHPKAQRPPTCLASRSGLWP